MTMWESLTEKISVDYIKKEILKTAYGNRETAIARVDARVLFFWYLFFAISPWLVYNRTVLIGIVLLLAVVAFLSRVSSLIVILLAFGIVSQVVGWGVAALFFGGDLSVFVALSTLWLKLLAASLASIAVFASMDPDRFSDGLLALGMPEQFAFGLSYGYRMIPVLFDEYNNVYNACRLRSKRPEKPGLFYFNWMVHYLRLVVISFYPMILNTAKRTRTTVEGLAMRGFTYAINHPEVKQVRLAYMKFTGYDVAFVLLTVVAMAAIFVVGAYFPL